MLSSESFIILVPTFESDPFGVHFVWCGVGVQFIVLHLPIQSSQLYSVEKTILSSLSCCSTLVENWLNMYIFYVWTLSFIPMTYGSLLLPLPHYLDYGSFVVWNQEVWAPQCTRKYALTLDINPVRHVNEQHNTGISDVLSHLRRHFRDTGSRFYPCLGEMDYRLLSPQLFIINQWKHSAENNGPLGLF